MVRILIRTRTFERNSTFSLIMKHNKMLGLPSLPVSATIIIQRESHMSIDIFTNKRKTIRNLKKRRFSKRKIFVSKDCFIHPKTRVWEHTPIQDPNDGQE
jgi:hypothetical protein